MAAIFPKRGVVTYQMNANVPPVTCEVELCMQVISWCRSFLILSLKYSRYCAGDLENIEESGVEPSDHSLPVMYSGIITMSIHG